MNHLDDKKRRFLKKLGFVGTTTLIPGFLACGCRSVFFNEDHVGSKIDVPHDPENPFSSSHSIAIKEQVKSAEENPQTTAHADHHANELAESRSLDGKTNVPLKDDHQKLITKSIDFNKNYPDDIFLKGEEFALLTSCLYKLKKLQNYVGFGHFNIVDWADGLEFAQRAKGIDRGFSSEEIKFLERLFYTRAEEYGFMGAKVFTEIDRGINRKKAVKVPYSGHYLVKGPSYEMYRKIKKDLGKDLILTSGARGTMKQFHLFLNKVVECKGNASMASRSIAPPGYSFHGRGDFDIGSKFLGKKNFTSDFANTKEYKKLVELGYVGIRYDLNNLEGVRFEPWHIKVEV